MAQDKKKRPAAPASKTAPQMESAKYTRDYPGMRSWSHLRNRPEPVEGPSKPWTEEMEGEAEKFVSFLKDAETKKMVHEFLAEAYKNHETARVNQLQARMEHEAKVQSRGATDYHTPGNLTPMMAEDFNMHQTEKTFARGLKTTQNYLNRTIDDRVEDINRLLANVGGFSAQIKSAFARSTVVFLEQEDPKYNYRERLIFSINLPNYELKRQWDRSGKAAKLSDGRSSLQATWDDAVNALARIVETTGLKPKYCKNDRHYGRFVMKQDLRSSINLPDEYFSFTLDYNTEEKIKEMCVPYDKIVRDYEAKIAKLAKKLAKYPEDSKSPRYAALKKQHLLLCQERDYFVGTTPDPNQLDEGLLFLIEVSTLKDYHIVKDRMQSIMTRYILYLSKIAAKEAEFDPELEYQLWKTGEKGRTESTAQAGAEGSANGGSEYADLSAEEIEALPQYTIEAGSLRPVAPPPAPPVTMQPSNTAKKKKAA